MCYYFDEGDNFSFTRKYKNDITGKRTGLFEIQDYS